MRALVCLALVACAEPPPAKRPAETVPANSLDEAKLHGTNEPGTAMTATPEPAPAVTGEATPVIVGSARPVEARAPAAPARGKATAEECARVMDRYLELEIGSNPQLKDVPPEAIAEAKRMAREKHGEAPCTATRAQISCALSASTTAAWQRCMK